MSTCDLTWKIGGEAGFGIASAGLIFAKTLNRLGYFVYGYLEYPSLIRGGHNVYEVHVSNEKVYSQEKEVDLLVCLNRETFDLHKDELKEQAVVIFDPLKTKIEDKGNYLLYPVAVSKIVKDLGGLPVMENNLFLGVSLALIKADKEIILNVVADTFRDKGEQVISLNQKMIQTGYDFVVQHPLEFSLKLKASAKANQRRSAFGVGGETTEASARGGPALGWNEALVMTGNEAVSLGAIAADCRLYAAYPMTPVSSILHTLAGYAQKSKMVVKHVGDEIEAINMLVGASFSGVRCMTGSAGGGFSLMVEGLGLAGVTESSIVIVIGQRPGPATGLPTWTSQGDLQFLIHAAQDEFPRIILAPGDVEEAYILTQKAFNLADLYQVPVFILTDKYLGEGLMSVDRGNLKTLPKNRGKLLSEADLEKSDDFGRYQVTDDGISPRSMVGQKNGVFIANSYEHDEKGFSTEDAQTVREQKEKSARKIATFLRRDFSLPVIYGSKEADLTIIAWGSTKAPVLEATRKLGDKVNFLHFTHVFPLGKEVEELLTQTKKTLLIEGNGTAQFGLLLREQTGFVPSEKMLKYDGRPFYPEEIWERVKVILKG